MIDFHEKTLLFGDSLGHYPDESVINVFLAWIKNLSGKDFHSERLTIAIQNDNFSCGMLAANAHAPPDNSPSQYCSTHHAQLSAETRQGALLPYEWCELYFTQYLAN